MTHSVDSNKSKDFRKSAERKMRLGKRAGNKAARRIIKQQARYAIRYR